MATHSNLSANCFNRKSISRNIPHLQPWNLNQAETLGMKLQRGGATIE